MDASDVVMLLQFSEISDFCRRHPVLIASVAATGISFLAARKYFAGGVCHSTARLDGKTVIITGGNTGIGKETAKDLACRGAKVILACRDLTKGERAAKSIIRETGNEKVLVHVLDLACLASVRRFCQQIERNEDRVDILINNAGVMACPQWESKDGYELQFAVNHLGHFLLTNLLLEKIKKSAPSRIVNVSSISHEKGQIHFDDINLKQKYKPFLAYSQSKLANVMFAQELDRRLKGTGVTAYSLHPGVVRTELGRFLHETVPRWKIVTYQPVIWFVFKNARQGAQTSIYCAVEEGIESQSGKYFSDCKVKDPAPQANDKEAAKKLWDISAKMVGLETTPQA